MCYVNQLQEFDVETGCFPGIAGSSSSCLVYIATTCLVDSCIPKHTNFAKDKQQTKWTIHEPLMCLIFYIIEFHYTAVCFQACVSWFLLAHGLLLVIHLLPCPYLHTLLFAHDTSFNISGKKQNTFTAQPMLFRECRCTTTKSIYQSYVLKTTTVR